MPLPRGRVKWREGQCEECLQVASCADCQKSALCGPKDCKKGSSFRILGGPGFAGYGAVDPNLIVSTIGETIGNLWGRHKFPSTQYIAPPTACSMFERATPAGDCAPNYPLLFVVVAATVAFASVSLGPRRR